MNKDILHTLFKDNGNPIEFTPGQLEIFYTILDPKITRANIKCCTQYGKSLTVACASEILVSILAKRVVVLAPSDNKAKIIMRYFIEHLSDSVLFYSQLEKDTKLERLKQEESKSRIITRNNGGIYTISCQTSNPKKGIEAAMGEGADIVILDEGALVPDDIEATIFRMIAGKKNGKYIKIGNPFKRNHFYKSSLDPNYKQIDIDYHQALSEGRYTQEFINEAMSKPFFDVLFENKFPDEKVVDERGYRLLITSEDKARAIIKEEPEPKGKPRLGIDIGRGGNKSVFGLRYDNYGIILEKNTNRNLMFQVSRAKHWIKTLGIKPTDVFVDDTGVGGGITDRLEEEELYVNGVRVGNPAVDKSKFRNIRAENSWLFREWLLSGGRLVDDDGWVQFEEIRYIEDSSSKLKMESKEDLAKRGVESPDEYDSLMLTFSNQQIATADDFSFA